MHHRKYTDRCHNQGKLSKFPVKQYGKTNEISRHTKSQHIFSRELPTDLKAVRFELFVRLLKNNTELGRCVNKIRKCNCFVSTVDNAMFG
jgi:hypothetical protein